MANTASQDNRLGRVATPLGKDKLLLTSFEATEAMGDLFEFRVNAISAEHNIDFNQILGRVSSVHLETVDGTGRDFSGILTDARRVGIQDNLTAYTLILKPWLWLLSLTSDCKIYKNKNAADIIRDVFKTRGFSHLVVDLITHDYPVLEYCVQYRETDLNYVLRLMEEYGIYFYFQFDKGDGSSPSEHYLVICDTASHPSLPGLSSIAFSPSAVGSEHQKQELVTWAKGQSMVTGIFTLNDYFYDKATADMVAQSQYPYQFAHGDLEIYDFPGDYQEKDNGKMLADVLRDAERPRNERSAGSGYCPTLTPGYVVERNSTVQGDPDNGSYLILKCFHVFGVQSYTTQPSAKTGQVTYYADYEFAKGDQPYRLQQRARRPVISGTQSALVVGQQGEEIDVDKEGRICVQFYWDRKKTASRRVRVAQFWAGSHRGAKFLPRIGDEVLIQYDEGDPDRPLVVGSVYNSTNPIPSDLPAKKNVSGILTKSTKNSSGYHMLTFDDTTGQEVIKLRSQRDLMFKALRNEQRDINGSQTENVGGDITQTVGGDFKISVGVQDPPSGGHYSLTATQSIVLGVGLESTITITEDSITIQSPMIYLNP